MVEALHEFQLSKEFYERFRIALEEKDESFIRQALREAKPEDLSAFLYEFSPDENKYVLDLLPVRLHAEVIDYFESDRRRDYLRIYQSAEIVPLMNELDSDDAADILNELPIRTREEVLLGLSRDLKAKVTELLRYEEDVAGGLMAKELIKIRSGWTVVQCVAEMRKQAEHVDKFYSAWVVDDQDRLLGSASLKDLVLSEARKTVGEICETDIVTVETHFSDKEVASIMRKYDLESVPVVNVLGQLVGRITIDDVVDVMAEQAEEERQLMSGISENIEEDDSLWRNTRARLPWLLIGILGGLVNAKFMHLFEDELSRITAIAFFTPLIQATGGNVGIQSSSLVVQSLAHPAYISEGMVRRLAKVFVLAVMNGLFLSLLVYAANVLLFQEHHLSFIVSVALFFVVIFASFSGTITPLLLDKFRFNPALAAGPFITTTNDFLGLTVYFLSVHFMI